MILPKKDSDYKSKKFIDIMNKNLNIMMFSLNTSDLETPFNETDIIIRNEIPALRIRKWNT